MRQYTYELSCSSTYVHTEYDACEWIVIDHNRDNGIVALRDDEGDDVSLWLDLTAKHVDFGDKRVFACL